MLDRELGRCTCSNEEKHIDFRSTPRICFKMFSGNPSCQGLVDVAVDEEGSEWYRYVRCPSVSTPKQFASLGTRNHQSSSSLRDSLRSFPGDSSVVQLNDRTGGHGDYIQLGGRFRSVILVFILNLYFGYFVHPLTYTV